MILKILLILTFSSFFYADEQKSIKELMEEMYKGQIETESIMAEGMVEVKDPKDIYFPDDTYLGLKCTRDRATVTVLMEDGWDIQKKDNLGNYYHKPYVDVEYFSLSPSQKKGMVVYHFSYWRNVDTDMYKFRAEEYSKKGPYESEKFEVSDYRYVVDFRDSAVVAWNREDLSFESQTVDFTGRNWAYSKIGPCVILETDDFLEDLESRLERVNELKERNQQIIDAKKSKRKF